MAEAILKQLLGDRIYVDSCGVRIEGGAMGDEADAYAVAVMEEGGYRLGGHKPKTFDDLNADAFDLIISLTPQAQHRAVEMTRGRASEIEYWATFDPTTADGSREARLAVYREVRDALVARIKGRFDLA
jgi:protein-tyrosine-phosphatase